MMRHSHIRQQQKGVALLIVLLLLATLGVSVVAVMETMRLATAKMQAVGDRDQARWHIYSVEQLALNVLTAQWQQEPAIDTLNEPWFAQEITFPIDQGVIVIRLHDATTCFNLNALVQRKDGEFVANAAAAERLKILGDDLGLGSGESQQIASVVTDWIDPDDSTEISGGEDGFYTRLAQPYRTGGQALANLSELRAMIGISPELYRGFSPYLCALPTQLFVGFNINMATERDIPALHAAFGGLLTLEETRTLIEQRPLEGYKSLDGFFALPVFEGKEVSDQLKQRFSLWSEYITLDAEIRYGTAYLRSQSLVQMRDSGNPIILNREFGPR